MLFRAFILAILIGCLLQAPKLAAQGESAQEKPAGEASGQPKVELDMDSFPTFPGLEPEVHNQLKVFFLLVQRGKVDAAYEALVKGTIIESRPADITVLRDKTKQAIQVFGEIRGYEVIELRRVGEHLLNVVVISLGDKFPLRWKLYFYHSRDAWRLIDIRVDDRLISLFGEEEAAQPSTR